MEQEQEFEGLAADIMLEIAESVHRVRELQVELMALAAEHERLPQYVTWTNLRPWRG